MLLGIVQRNIYTPPPGPGWWWVCASTVRKQFLFFIKRLTAKTFYFFIKRLTANKLPTKNKMTT